MNHETRRGWKGFRGQETVFSICMGIVALLGRDNPMLSYPEVLWAFGAFLLFNLAVGVALRGRAPRWVAFLSVAGNSGLIAAILAYSGGAESYFWPMYLLPIFTACLALEGAHVLLALAFPAGFMSLSYLEALWRGPGWEPLELALKLFALALAASVTRQVALRERRSREDVERLRSELDRREKSLSADKDPESAAQARRLIHDINNPLTLIIGSADLLLLQPPADAEQRRDIERIRTAAKRCGELLSLLATRVAPRPPAAVLEERP